MIVPFLSYATDVVLFTRGLFSYRHLSGGQHNEDIPPDGMLPILTFQVFQKVEIALWKLDWAISLEGSFIRSGPSTVHLMQY